MIHLQNIDKSYRHGLSQTFVLRRVTAAIRVGERRWNLQMDNGIDVRLPVDR